VSARSRAAHVGRHPALVGWLALVWVGLWGSVTVANVLGGLVVAVALLWLLPLPEDAEPGRVRPGALLRFVAFFAVELVKASLIVVWQVLRPRGELRQAVLAVDAVGASDRLLTLVANAISLTPGTLTLEVDRERSILYVHALDVGGPEGVERARRSIERLERLAILAIGTPECLERLDASTRRREVGST
jgi:multicomponent Na+:H+ antiporter subunit E